MFPTPYRRKHELSEAERDRHLVRAPSDGVVTRLYRQKSESCDLNHPLLDLIDLTRAVFVAQVEEIVGRRLAKGQTLALSLQAGADSLERTGTITFLSPVVDPASGLMEVRVELDMPMAPCVPAAPG